MRNALFLFSIVILIVSCKKSLNANRDSYLNESFYDTVGRNLEKIMSPDKFSMLDFSKAIKSDLIKGKYYVRIAFKGHSLIEKHLNVVTEPNAKILIASIMTVDGLGKGANVFKKPLEFECKITTEDLLKKMVYSSTIRNGKIVKLSRSDARNDAEEAPDTDVNQDFLPENYLPPVIVVGYIHSDFGGGGGFTFFIGTPGMESSFGTQVAQTFDPVTGAVGNQLLEIEIPEPKPKTDLKKMLKCFSGVSSYGNVSYTVTLCADIPVNWNSNAYFNFSFSPGHSFLTLSKTNGTNQITQSFGFYPGEGGDASQIKDNGRNEFNASIKMNLNEEQFEFLMQKIESLSQQSYSLNDFNCTDFAIQAFNSVRSVPLTVPTMEISVGHPGIDPSTVAAFSGSSPQSLFNKLNEMKNNGGSEASNISIDRSHNSNAPRSHGECN